MDPEQVDRDLRKIINVAGILLIVFGLLIMWRGIFKMIPYTGLVNGGLFTLGGLVILILGVLFLTVPRYRDKKRRAQSDREEDESNP